jgi:hypothetical protein
VSDRITVKGGLQPPEDDDLVEELAEMLGVTTYAIQRSPIDDAIGAYVRRMRGDPLSHSLCDFAWLTVCPMSYALARNAGYDPAAIVLLERNGCWTRVDSPEWELSLHADPMEHDLLVCGLVAPGVVMEQDPNTLETYLSMVPARTGMPETVLAAALDRLPGRPLSDLLTHPAIDAASLVVREIVVPSDNSWTVRFDRTPRRVPLEKAAHLHDRRTAPR